MTTNVSRTHTLGVLYGDGIGPEIVPAAVLIADAAIEAADAAPIHWRELPLGFKAIDEFERGDTQEHTGRTRGDRRLAARTPRQRRLSRAVPLRAQPQRHHPQALRSVRERASRQGPFQAAALWWPTRISSSCARTPKGSTPTAAPSAAPASSCPRPIRRHRAGHHHPAARASGSPGRRSSGHLDAASR